MRSHNVSEWKRNIVMAPTTNRNEASGIIEVVRNEGEKKKKYARENTWKKSKEKSKRERTANEASGISEVVSNEGKKKRNMQEKRYKEKGKKED